MKCDLNLALLNVFFPNNEKILIAVIYRSPSASQMEFRNCFEKFMDKLARLNTSYPVTGDFIIDLLNLVSDDQNTPDSNTLKFLECPLSHQLYSVCLVPSRITDTSYSLIDITFSSEGAVSTYVIPDDSSDHCILMVDFWRYFPHNKKKSTKRRDFGEFIFFLIKRSTR